VYAVVISTQCDNAGVWTLFCFVFLRYKMYAVGNSDFRRHLLSYSKCCSVFSVTVRNLSVPFRLLKLFYLSLSNRYFTLFYILDPWKYIKNGRKRNSHSTTFTIKLSDITTFRCHCTNRPTNRMSVNNPLIDRLLHITTLRRRI
jgi:hypothetical protein